MCLCMNARAGLVGRTDVVFLGTSNRTFSNFDIVFALEQDFLIPQL